MLMVQRSIGHSDYERRDAALQRLIVPLAGEYGMHNGEAQSARDSRLVLFLFVPSVLCTVFLFYLAAATFAAG